MNNVQERIERKVFHSQDFVLWHYRSNNQFIPVPAVVVDEKDDKVIIRARIEGSVKEFAVGSEELTER